MATFRRIEDDSLDDELGPSANKSSDSNVKKDNIVDLDIGNNSQQSNLDRSIRQDAINNQEQKTNFKRIEDDSLDDELSADAPKPTEKKSDSVPELTPVIPTIEPVIPKSSSADIDSAEPKKSAKFPVALIAVILILVLAGGGFFAFKFLKKEKPVFLITYTSKDPSVKVLLNGSEYSAEEQAGIYSIKLDKGQASSLVFKKEGYKDKKVDVDTSTDLSKDLGEIVLEKQIPKNTVFFVCKEPDVEILLDNEKQDIQDKDGSYTLSNVSEGKHSIVFKKIGFKTINKDFELSKDEGIELGDFALEVTNFKRIEIDVTPKDVEVYIDGELVKTEIKGNSLRTDYLEPKVVSVEIRAKGFKPYKNESFEIYPDISSYLGPITLEKIVEKKSDKKEEKKK